MNVLWAVLWKDLLTEWRSRDRVVAMLVFSLLVVVVFHFSLPGGATARTQENAPGLLWIAYVFAALLGLGRAFSLELENDALSGLCLVPADRGWVFLGKAVANLIALFGLQVWTAILFSVFLDVEWGPALPAALGIALLGATGLSALGSLLSAMSMFVRFRDFLFPILLFPLVLPLLVMTSRMTETALEGGAISGLAWFVLVLYDWIFVWIGYFVFDYVLED